MQKSDCLQVSRLSDLSTFFSLYCSKSWLPPIPPFHFPFFTPPSLPDTHAATRKFLPFWPFYIFANAVPCAENTYTWQTLIPRPSSNITYSRKPPQLSFGLPQHLWAYFCEGMPHTFIYHPSCLYLSIKYPLRISWGHCHCANLLGKE